jgi:hypothetical protein
LAAVPFGADRGAVDDLAAVHGRIVRATDEEMAAASATVARVLSHSIMQRARDAEARGACRREAPVTSTVGRGELVEGVVDLAFEEHGAWTVVDYKTDREIAAAGEERYKRQVAFYARAIAEATGSQRAVCLCVCSPPVFPASLISGTSTIRASSDGCSIASTIASTICGSVTSPNRRASRAFRAGVPSASRSAAARTAIGARARARTTGEGSCGAGRMPPASARLAARGLVGLHHRRGWATLKYTKCATPAALAARSIRAPIADRCRGTAAPFAGDGRGTPTSCRKVSPGAIALTNVHRSNGSPTTISQPRGTLDSSRAHQRRNAMAAVQQNRMTRWPRTLLLR